MTLVAVALGLLILLILIGMPVGFAAGIASMVGAALLFGGPLDPRVTTLLARTSLDKMNDFLLLAIPFFLLAGRLMNTGGITERLFGFVSVLVRPLRGGLGHANVLASVLFAGMSGSATADAMGLGQIEMRAMLQQGYERRFSAGITAASSLLGPILPPSIVLIAFAVQAEVSVAALFFAAVLPALLIAVTFMAYVAVLARLYDMPRGSRAGIGEIWTAFRPAFLAILTPGIIMGGIWFGIFTPTEAAAVAALYALILTVFVYREAGWRRVLEEIRGTLIDTSVIMLIIAFTSTLGLLLIRSQVPTELAALLATLTESPIVLLLLFLGLWIVVGCFMAQTAAVLILTPILMPISLQFGINPLHLGIVMTLGLTMGLLTPPVGMVLYALVRVTGLTFEQLAWVSIPYVLLLLGVVIVLIVFPDVTLVVPRLMGFRAAL